MFGWGSKSATSVKSKASLKSRTSLKSVGSTSTAGSAASSASIPILKKKDKRKSFKAKAKGRKSVSIRKRGSKKDKSLSKAPDPHWQSRTFGIFEKKLESPIGFYREKDKYYDLKKEYEDEPTKLKMIEEMWQYRQGYQIRKRYKWPPKSLVGRYFWSWGYYDDTLRERHAHILVGEDGQEKYVELEDEYEQESSDDEYGRNPYYDRENCKDWKSILIQYKLWKKNIKGGRKSMVGGGSGVTKTEKASMLGKTATGLFRDELDNVDFDTLEAELLRRKSLGLINTPSYEKLLKRKSSFYHKDDVPKDTDDETVTTVTTEYILIKTPKDKRKSTAASKEKRKSRKSVAGAARKSRKSTVGARKSRLSVFGEEEDDSDDSDDSDDEEEEGTVSTVDKRKSRKSRKSKAPGTGRKSQKAPADSTKGVILPGLTQAESERLWAAYDSADSSQSIQPLGAKVTTTENKRKSVAARKSVKK